MVVHQVQHDQSHGIAQVL
ncbi:hypothetical protein M5D96_013794 [Drosophila gunungcola]|uniref:Uncharacterized protein n=1 Tax=Drosophila gunungcola TaxID=103775 RepID=A0A9P9YAN5_9MUSC|nr:hypothetical protein M5D96_013794 [Drosophila gunungcola]